MPEHDLDTERAVHDLSCPLMLAPRRRDEVPPGRPIPTLLHDFHHVHWQLLQRRGLADQVPTISSFPSVWPSWPWVRH